MNKYQLFTLEFRESDVSPQTRQICRIYIQAKGYFRETYKSLNINPISPTPKFTLGRGVSASKIVVTMLLHLRFPLICYAT